MKFEFENMFGTLRPFKVMKATTMPHGPDSKPTRVTEVQLELELEANSQLEEIRWLFSDIDLRKMGKVIGSDDDRGGTKINAHTKLPPMNFAMFYKEDEEPIFERTNCTVASQPYIQFNEKGDAKLVLRPRVKLTDVELPKVCALLDATIRVSTEKTQVDLSEDTKLAVAA